MIKKRIFIPIFIIANLFFLTFCDFTKKNISTKEQIYQHTLIKLLNNISKLDTNKAIIYKYFYWNSTQEEIKHLFINKPKELSLVEKLCNQEKKQDVNLDKLFENSKIKFISRELWGDKKADFKIINGLLTISDIVFNEEQNVGLYALRWLCKGDCGGEYLVFIRKKANIWVTEQVILISIF